MVGMDKDKAQRTNIFSLMDYKYMWCAICDDHNHFSYEVKLPTGHFTIAAPSVGSHTLNYSLTGDKIN